MDNVNTTQFDTVTDGEREEIRERNKRNLKRYRERMKEKGYKGRLVYIDDEVEFKLKRYADINGLKPYGDFNEIINRLFTMR